MKRTYVVTGAASGIGAATAAISSCSATGGPGRSILHYFCRE
jgi:NAD(P)-dependent dehydrogenase (short-subunit alcohol dehydrogenase family)